MAYGQIPVLREYGSDRPSGADVRWTARFGHDNLVQSYRGFKAEWHATPATAPRLVARKGKGACGRGLVSWNGATDVEKWVVYAGKQRVGLQEVGSVRYRGFETEFGIGRGWIQVAAVVRGRVGQRSDVVPF